MVQKISLNAGLVAAVVACVIWSGASAIPGDRSAGSSAADQVSEGAVTSGDKGGVASGGATIFVPTDYRTIQQAVDAASDGDEIIVAPGIYSEKISMVARSITIRSTEGAEVTIIDGQGDGPVFTIVCQQPAEQYEVVLDGFTITGGVGSTGGGLAHIACFQPQEENRVVSINNCDFVGNTASVGGAVAGRVSITNSMFHENTAIWGGGALFVRGWVESSVFVNNSVSGGGGGAIAVNGGLNTFLTVSSSHFENNSAGSGGAIHVPQGNTALIDGSVFIANTAAGNGGALRAWGITSATITDSHFENNSATRGGALFADVDVGSAVISCSGCVFIENTAAIGGGAFYSRCMVIHHEGLCGKGNFNNCDFIGNTAGEYGGAIRHSCVMYTDYDWKGNPVVYTVCGKPNITGCTFNGNAAGIAGGAIGTTWPTMEAAPKVKDTTFCFNQPQAIFGAWNDNGGNAFLPPYDLSCDGVVNGADLAILLAQWGPCEDCDNCPADLENDCIVDGFDLLMLLANWGPVQQR